MWFAVVRRTGVVNNNELYLQYRQAIQLIRVGRYEESLRILQEIDAERPETKNVLYALAVCCEMLGRLDEAVALCDRLIAKYDHPKALIIKARIERAASEPELPQEDLLGSIGLRMPPTAPTFPPLSSPPSSADKDEAIPFAVPVTGGESMEKNAKNWILGFGKKS
jgi:tetratricopeptide (TPR) repeat protein